MLQLCKDTSRRASITSWQYHKDHAHCFAASTQPLSSEPDAVQLFKIDLTLAYNVFPRAVLPPTGQKPLICKVLRACLTASIHRFNGPLANCFFARADAALETILPDLLFVSSFLCKPPVVRSFVPWNTAALALEPFAILLTRFAFFIFLVAFMADFIATIHGHLHGSLLHGFHCSQSHCY